MVYKLLISKINIIIYMPFGYHMVEYLIRDLVSDWFA